MHARLQPWLPSLLPLLLLALGLAGAADSSTITLENKFKTPQQPAAPAAGQQPSSVTAVPAAATLIHAAAAAGNAYAGVDPALLYPSMYPATARANSSNMTSSSTSSKDHQPPVAAPALNNSVLHQSSGNTTAHAGSSTGSTAGDRGRSAAGVHGSSIAATTATAATTAATAAGTQDSAAQSNVSTCAARCFGAAEALGWATVANDALACFTPYNTTHVVKQLSTYDCCDVAELLLGKFEQAPLQECLCCPEFAAAFLGSSVPYKRLNTTAEAYATKLSLCRVPIYGLPGPATCSSNSSSGMGVLAQQGPVDELDPSLPLTGGSASRYGGSYQPTPFFLVSGASRIYDAALTGFVRWIEDNVPQYPLPMAPQLPPLDPKYAPDVAYVANLRRGAYPDLIKHRPPRYSMAATDPLQNGAVDTLPPTIEYSGPPDSSP